MTFDSDRVSRRRFIAASGTAGILSMAGCLSSGQQQSGGPSALRIGGSSTVYPITSDGGSVWNSNPPASDAEYWGPGQYGIDTDRPLADYWASKYGFETGDSGRPPFRVTVGLSHSGTGIEKVMNRQLDVADSSAPVEAELPDEDQETYDKFVDHVVARDGQPIVVSRAVYDAGVTGLTADQVRAIYRGEITDWSQIDAYSGPSREIQAVGRSEGSGTDTAFRVNMLGGPNASMSGVDVRKGQNQQVKTLVSNSDNAIAYMALAFVDQNNAPAISLTFDGTEFVPGENLGSADYPLSRDLHCYTWEETSLKEAAFLHMLLSDFGQQNYVAPNDYFTIPAEERQQAISELPSP
jgi:phosphate transport system substrate-binding protein